MGSATEYRQNQFGSSGDTDLEPENAFDPFVHQEDPSTEDESSVKLDIKTQASTSKALPRDKLVKVLYLGFAFFILFIAYILTQNTLTALYKELGFISLAVVYIMLGIGSLFTPALNEKLGYKLSFVLASFTYVFWIFTLTVGIHWLVLFSSALLGVGGSLLWVTQGVYMTDLSEGQNVGAYNGYFYVVFNMNMIIGTLGLKLLLYLNFPLSFLPKVMTVVGLVGVFLLCFIRPVNNVSNKKDEKSTEKETEQVSIVVTTWKSIKDITYQAKDVKLCMLLFGIIFQGISSTLTIAVVPIMLDAQSLSYFFLAYGISKVLFSYGSGIAYDKFTWMPVLLFNFVSVMISYFCIHYGSVHHSAVWFYIYGILIGASECCMTTLLNSTIMELYTENSAPAFAVYRFVNSIASGLALFFAQYVTYQQLIFVNIFLLFGTTICYFILYYVVMKKPKYSLLNNSTVVEGVGNIQLNHEAKV